MKKYVFNPFLYVKMSRGRKETICEIEKLKSGRPKGIIINCREQLKVFNLR